MKLSLDHPHHTLYQIFALSRADKIHQKAQNFAVDREKMKSALGLFFIF